VVGGNLRFEISCTVLYCTVMKWNAVVSGVRGLARLRRSLPEVSPACSGEGHVTLEGLSFLLKLSTPQVIRSCGIMLRVLAILSCGQALTLQFNPPLHSITCYTFQFPWIGSMLKPRIISAHVWRSLIFSFTLRILVIGYTVNLSIHCVTCCAQRAMFPFPMHHT
jgi:hypothetical protein